MSEYLINGTKLTNIADAIREKTGETAQMGVDAMPAKIRSISAGGSGGGSTPTPTPASVDVDKDILFIDYDGTPVASWTLEQLAAKTALPAAPTHAGLTFQEWNWTLEQLKAENAPMVVGANYITDDGKTRLYIRLDRSGRLTYPLRFNQTVENGVTINWGDGSAEETAAGTEDVNVSHTYAAGGRYTITLLPAEGCTFTLIRDLTVMTDWIIEAVQAVELGRGITSLVGKPSYGAFYGFSSLKSISVPKTVTDMWTSTFSGCGMLKGVVIPAGVTTVRSALFQDCKALLYASCPKSVTSVLERAFQSCAALLRADLPKTVATLGAYALAYCYSLPRFVIPEGVTAVPGNLLLSAKSVMYVKAGTGVTSVGNYAFQAAYSGLCYDFTACTAVPEFSGNRVFFNIPADCQIRVPAALESAWKAVANLSSYTNYIVGVSGDD